MEKDLESKVKNFRKKMLGKKLAEKYPLDFSENDNPLYPYEMSSSDFRKFVLNMCGKVIIPGIGDKFIFDYVRLENKIHPEDKWVNYITSATTIIGRYIFLGSFVTQLIA
jgi:hypothetical protein